MQNEFDVAVGASGGVLNLVQVRAGRSGSDIADFWRRYRPLRSIAAGWPPWPPFRLSRFERNVVEALDLDRDWKKIKAPADRASLAVYDYTSQRVVHRRNQDWVVDDLLTAITLPGWFPLRRRDGHDLGDAVYATDGDLLEGVRLLCEGDPPKLTQPIELWVIWTVSVTGGTRRGPVDQYFQKVEAAANSQLRVDLDRIRDHNAQVRTSGSGTFGVHPITVHLLQAEVPPLHYLFSLNRDRFAESVELGVREARAWSAPGPLVAASAAVDPGIGCIHLKERFLGPLSCVDADGVVDEESTSAAVIELRQNTGRVGRFITDPEHRGTNRGTVRIEGMPLLDIVDGTFQLHADAGPGSVLMGRRSTPDPDLMSPWDVHSTWRRGSADPVRYFRYRLQVQSSGGAKFLVLGDKVLANERGWDLWPDTTKLFVRVYEASQWPSSKEHPDAHGRLAFSGWLRIPLGDFAKLVLTMKVDGPWVGRPAAMFRFQRYFLGTLARLYRRRGGVVIDEDEAIAALIALDRARVEGQSPPVVPASS
jgi:hypothetical protein